MDTAPQPSTSGGRAPLPAGVFVAVAGERGGACHVRLSADAHALSNALRAVAASGNVDGARPLLVAAPDAEPADVDCLNEMAEYLVDEARGAWLYAPELRRPDWDQFLNDNDEQVFEMALETSLQRVRGVLGLARRLRMPVLVAFCDRLMQDKRSDVELDVPIKDSVEGFYENDEWDEEEDEEEDDEGIEIMDALDSPTVRSPPAKGREEDEGVAEVNV